MSLRVIMAVGLGCALMMGCGRGAAPDAVPTDEVSQARLVDPAQTLARASAHMSEDTIGALFIDLAALTRGVLEPPGSLSAPREGDGHTLRDDLAALMRARYGIDPSGVSAVTLVWREGGDVYALIEGQLDVAQLKLPATSVSGRTIYRVGEGDTIWAPTGDSRVFAAFHTERAARAWLATRAASIPQERVSAWQDVLKGHPSAPLHGVVALTSPAVQRALPEAAWAASLTLAHAWWGAQSGEVRVEGQEQALHSARVLWLEAARGGLIGTANKMRLSGLQPQTQLAEAIEALVTAQLAQRAGELIKPQVQEGSLRQVLPGAASEQGVVWWALAQQGHQAWTRAQRAQREAWVSASLQELALGLTQRLKQSPQCVLEAGSPPREPEAGTCCARHGGPGLAASGALCAPDAPGWDHPAWAALGFRPDRAHGFAFELEPEGEPGQTMSWVLRARGDADCDDVRATYELRVRVVVAERGQCEVSVGAVLSRNVED